MSAESPAIVWPGLREGLLGWGDCWSPAVASSSTGPNSQGPAQGSPSYLDCISRDDSMWRGWPGQHPPQIPALLHWGASSASLVLSLLLTNGSMASFLEASFSLPNALQVSAGQAPVPVTEASQARACGGGGSKGTSQRSALCTGGQLRAPSQQLPRHNGDRLRVKGWVAFHQSRAECRMASQALVCIGGIREVKLLVQGHPAPRPPLALRLLRS